MKIIENDPSANEEKAKARARDARTVGSLVRAIERLMKAEEELEKKGSRAKSRRDAELKDKLLRKLDQIVAGREQSGVPDGPKRG
jgi:hypothetical protein